MIKALSFINKDKVTQKIPIDKVEEQLKQDNVVWVDAIKPSNEEFDQLQHIFKIHELTIEDTRTAFHLPKLDEYPEYLFLIWYTLNDKPNTVDIEHSQINIYLGSNFIVTVHDNKNNHIEPVFQKCCQEDPFSGKGADWILHLLLDRFVDEYFPFVDRMSQEIDSIEEAIFIRPDRLEMKKLFAIKHKLMDVKKIISPQRDIISMLTRFEGNFISAEHIMYYRDIFDHLMRVLDLADSSRDVVNGVVDIYMSSISNRMNEIMTRLTIVATIFLPLTLITGVYGMNFKHMPELYTRYGYYTVLAVIIGFGFGSYFYFKKKMRI